MTCSGKLVNHGILGRQVARLTQRHAIAAPVKLRRHLCIRAVLPEYVLLELYVDNRVLHLLRCLVTTRVRIELPACSSTGLLGRSLRKFMYGSAAAMAASAALQSSLAASNCTIGV